MGTLMYFIAAITLPILIGGLIYDAMTSQPDDFEIWQTIDRATYPELYDNNNDN